ncbi:MAG: hypothetical protein K9N35_03790 [Candidatus Marinimicrobia bacterium]|nr:hypothetical protein [Candidatus Neomarinimicrobiota bacterium]
MKLKKLITILLVLIICLALLSTCMPNAESAMNPKPAGFFKGVWHGWIAPLSLIVGFFNDTTRVYDPNNTGWWYDFGFYMAVISGFGGLSLARRKQKD